MPQAEQVEEFASWMKQHDKSYDTIEEHETRFQNYLNNLEYINQENAKEENTHTLGINHFSDMTDEEWISKYT